MDEQKGIEIIEKITNGLGESTETIWASYMEQQFIGGCFSVFWMIIACIAVTVFWKLYCKEDDKTEALVRFGLFLLLSGLVFVAAFASALMNFLTPEAEAFGQILRSF